MILNEEKVSAIIKKYENDEKVKRKERIFHQKIIGVKKSGLLYAHTQKEIKEIILCSSDPIYFIENYLNKKLHSYQIDIIRHYQQNSQCIFMNSRETGVDQILEMLFLHMVTFNCDKYILIGECSVKSDLKNIREHYKKLPFFLKQGVTKWDNNSIKFENGSRISHMAVTKNFGIGYELDAFLLKNAAYCKEEIFVRVLRNIIPTIASIRDSKTIISSTFNGYNHFMKMVENSERKEGDPQKNNYSTHKTYWWEIPNRNEEWRSDKIKETGIELFEREYNLGFSSKKFS